MKVLNKINADFDNTINNNNEIIKNIRIENFNEFKKTGIPTSKEEFWKYTDPSVVNNSEFSLGIPNNFEDKEQTQDQQGEVDLKTDLKEE